MLHSRALAEVRDASNYIVQGLLQVAGRTVGEAVRAATGVGGAATFAKSSTWLFVGLTGARVIRTLPDPTVFEQTLQILDHSRGIRICRVAHHQVSKGIDQIDVLSSGALQFEL